MSAARWIVTAACVLSAACSCESTVEDAGPDEDVGHDGVEVGDEGREETEAIDDDGTENADVHEHRDVEREDGGADADQPDISPMPPVCGDGAVDPGEECDDGNRLNGDGCDWLCRIGSDPFEYPPPDPDARPVEPGGPPAEVADETEISSHALADSGFTYCHPLWLAAGGGRFALAYDYDQPYYGVRLRIIDRAGETVGEPWSHETRWSFFEQALFPAGDGFGLLSASLTYGMMRSRFTLDGTPLEELMPLRPSYDLPDVWDALVSGAYREGRWLAVSFHYGGEFDWLLESFADDGAPADLRAFDIGATYGCVSAVSTESGFAIGDGNQVVLLDGELNVLSWSGSMSGGVGYGSEGAMDITPDGFWIAWWVGQNNNSPDPKSLWVAALDLDGMPRFPPRRILEGVPNILKGAGTGPYTEMPEVAVADGPAGAAIVYWQGMEDEETAGGPVMLITLDDWGNIITPPTPVLGEGEITTIGWVLAADADDLGYGAVTMAPGDLPGTARLVFRHFVAVP